ncbi:hypothetical protein D3C71_1277720 [compost metagenome]
MNDKRKISAMNSRIINFSDKLTKAIVAEVEEILEDAENVVKEFAPSRFVRKTLASIEAKLENEGIEVEFEKSVTREALKRTASEEANEDELEELAKVIAEAVVDELEEVLEDADGIMDEERGTTLSAEEDDTLEVESKLKSIVERKLHAKGVYVRFQRTAKKKTIVEKIRDARNRK